MSTQTNTNYSARSMNGIISYDDGAGGTMEGGVVTCEQLVVPQLNVNNIQGTTPTANITLYTDTNPGNLTVGGPNVGTTHLVGKFIYVESATSQFWYSPSELNITTGTNTNINSAVFNVSATGNITMDTVGNIRIGDNSALNTITGTTLTLKGNDTIILDAFSDTDIETGRNLIMNTVGNTTMNGSTIVIGDNLTKRIDIGNISTTMARMDAITTRIDAVADAYVEAGNTIYLNSIGNTEVCTGNYGGKLVLSGAQSIRAKDRSMSSYLFTDSTGGNVRLGNASCVFYVDCPISCNDTIVASQFNAPNGYLTQLDSDTINVSTLNVSTLVIGSTSFVTLNTSTSNTSTLNASIANVGGFNFTTNTMKLNTSGAMNIGTTNSNKIYLGNISNASTAGVICTKILSEDTVFNLCADNSATTNAQTLNIGTNVSYTNIATGTGYGCRIATIQIKSNAITSLNELQPLSFGGVTNTSALKINIGTNQNTVVVGNAGTGYNTTMGGFVATNLASGPTLDGWTGSSYEPNASGTFNIGGSLTVGTLNIAPNVTSAGAVNIGNSTATGSFSVSEGTINLNPKTTMNLANQIGTGTVNICNANTFNGTLNIGATLPTSGVNTINIGSNSTAVNLNCPLIPLYTPVATNGTSIGDVGYTYYNTTVTAGTFLTNVITTSLTQSVPAGIWFVYAVVPIRCTINNTLTYQQVAISDTGSTFFYALSSSFCSHNPPTVNGDCWYSCSGIAVLTATTTLIATIKMTFNVVGAYTRFGQFARLSATRIA